MSVFVSPQVDSPFNIGLYVGGLPAVENSMVSIEKVDKIPISTITMIRLIRHGISNVQYH